MHDDDWDGELPGSGLWFLLDESLVSERIQMAPPGMSGNVGLRFNVIK